MSMKGLPRRWRIWVGVLICYGLVMTFGGCADRLILYPSTAALDVRGLERVVVDYGDKKVEAWAAHLGDGEPRLFVLEFTGNATRAEQVALNVAGRYREHAAEVWVMNYPGYGGSEGPAKLKAIAPAAMAVMGELKRRAGDRPIILSGNSLGTAAALHVAAQEKVAGLVLQNPPALRPMILRHGWWNLWLLAGPVALQVPSSLDSVANAAQVYGPAVFLSADADEVVPQAYHQKVINAYAGPKRVIQLKGAGHNSPVDGRAERELADGIRWIVEARSGGQ